MYSGRLRRKQPPATRLDPKTSTLDRRQIIRKISRSLSRLIATFREYRTFFIFSVVPPVAPYIVVTYVFTDTDWNQVVDGTSLFLIAVGLCGNLMVKAVAVERYNDRRLISELVFSLLLAASVGLGIGLKADLDAAPNKQNSPNQQARISEESDGPDPYTQVAFVVAAIAAFPTAIHLAIVSIRPTDRKVIDLRETSHDEISDQIVQILRLEPQIAALIRKELET